MNDSYKDSIRVLGFLAFFVLCLNYLLFVYYQIIKVNTMGGYLDFQPHYAAAKYIWDGTNVYNTDLLIKKTAGVMPRIGAAYVYLPIVAVMITPLTSLSYDKATLVWTIFNQILLGILLFFLIKSLEKEGKSFLLGLIAILVFNYFPLRYTIGLGQINLLALTLLTGTYYFFKKKKDYLAGLFLALASVVKLPIMIFFAYFLYKREYKTFLAGAASFLMLFALSIILVGWQIHWVYLRDILPTQLPQNSHYLNINHMGLNGFIFMVFGAEKYRTLSAATTVLILGLSAYVLRGRLRDRGKKFDLEFSLILIVMIVIGGTTWVHHYVFILPAFVVLSDHMARKKAGYASLSVLAISYVLVAVDWRLYMRRIVESGKILPNWMMLYGGVIVLVFLMWLLFSESRLRMQKIA